MLAMALSQELYIRTVLCIKKLIYLFKFIWKFFTIRNEHQIWFNLPAYLYFISFIFKRYSVTSSSGFDYFYIEAAGSAKLSISQIDIYYTSSDTSTATYADVATNQYRINPVKSTSSLVSGTTSISIPTAISRSGSTYSISESKTLTYYSYSDVINGTYTAEEASVTDPFDIAAYYCAFGKAPANYVFKR